VPDIIKSITTVDGVRIELRSDTLNDDDLLFIHMGAGVADATARAVIANYDDYRGLESASGLLCVSVFGLAHGVTKANIFDAMPQKQYGEARFGQIKHLVRVIPTTIRDDDASPEIAAIQLAHFDLVLGDPVIPALATQPVADLNAADQEALKSQVIELLAELLPKFKPRTRKDTLQ
jgi:hypothetical protein